MKVKDLITALSSLDQETEVLLYFTDEGHRDLVNLEVRAVYNFVSPEVVLEGGFI